MPFDPSGNFTRVHNWQQDRDNGIRILADRHDAEDDNFAAGFNQAFLRTGTVPMTGNLVMNGSNIRGIGAGAEATPSLTWELSPSTGFWQPNPTSIAFSSAGVQKAQFNNQGLAVYGDLNWTGNSSVTGTVNISGNVGVGGNLSVSGTSAFGGAATASAGIFLANKSMYGTNSTNLALGAGFRGIADDGNFMNHGLVLPHYGIQYGAPDDAAGNIVGFAGSYGGFRIMSAGAERARFDAFGTSLDSLARVKGAGPARLEIDGGTVNSTLSFMVAGVSKALVFYDVGSAAFYNDADFFNFRNVAGSPLMAINGGTGQVAVVHALTVGGNTTLVNLNTSGNVAISGSLDVQNTLVARGAGNILSMYTVTPRDSGNNYMAWHDPTGRKAWMGYGGADDNFALTNERPTAITISTNGRTGMFISPQGNVGVGTTAPANFGGYTGLTVDNPAAGGLLELSAGAGKVFRAQVNAGGANALVGMNTAHPMSFMTNALGRMTILANGFVGVGTDAPVRNFQVNGDAEFGYGGAGVLLNVGQFAIVLNSPAGGVGSMQHQEAGVLKVNNFWHPPTGTYYSDVDNHIWRSASGGTKLQLNASIANFQPPRLYVNGVIDCNTTIQAGPAGAAGVGKVGLHVGDTLNTGYVEFFNATPARLGFIGNISYTTGAANAHIAYNNEAGGGHMFTGAGGVFPSVDAGPMLGKNGNRWYSVYASIGTINTSDEREKDWVGAASAAEIKAAGRIIDELGFYTWNTGIDAFTHFGARAQQVLRIMMEEGLEETQDIDFASDEYVETPPTFKYAFVDFGTWPEVVQPAPPPQEGEEPPEPIVTPGGNRFGMNMAELGLFISTAQHARLNALEARLDAGGL